MMRLERMIMDPSLANKSVKDYESSGTFGADNAKVPVFYQRLINKFNFKEVFRSKKIAFIVVGHRTHTLPYFLQALSSMGPIATLISKGSCSSEGIADDLSKIYSPIISEMSKETLASDDTRDIKAVEGYLQNLIDTKQWKSYRFVIIDHGGYFAPRLKTIMKKEYRKHILGCVEHTLNGELSYADIIKLLADRALPFPIRSIARSLLKAMEDKLIGQSIVDALRGKIFSGEGLNQVISRLKHIAIIGYGHIGKSTALSLWAQPDLYLKYGSQDPETAIKFSICDLNSEALSQAKDNHPEAYVTDNKNDFLADSDLIIVATSRRALTREDFAKLKPGVCIACATSKDSLFEPDAMADYELVKKGPTLTTYRYKKPQTGEGDLAKEEEAAQEKLIHLAHDGRSINFLTGSTPHPILHAVFASVCVNAYRLIEEYYAHAEDEIENQVIPSNRADDEKIEEIWENVFGQIEPMTLPELWARYRVGPTHENRAFYQKTVAEHLREYYKANATITLPVFEAPQHVKDSYVHLALVDGGTAQKQQSLLREAQSQFAKSNKSSSKVPITQLETNLNVWPGRIQAYEDFYRVKESILTDSIFNEHSRAMIIGRAGIGKTTFCKYVLWQWSEGCCWTQYEHVYCLPLRYLISFMSSCDTSEGLSNAFGLLAKFIEFTLQSQSKTVDIYKLDSQKIKAQLVDKDVLEKTLFVLDGLDELAAFIRGNEKDQERAHEFFKFLLKLPCYLLTSRPHAIDLVRFVELKSIPSTSYYELMGFQDSEISQYVYKVFELNKKSKSDAVELIGVMQRNLSIWGTAHIPINLALICAAWQPGLFSSQEHVTMTRLYEVIIHRLYLFSLTRVFKDGQEYEQIQSIDNPIHLTAYLSARRDLPRNRGRKELISKLELFHFPTAFLAELAFEGMLNHQLIFSYEDVCNVLSRHQLKLEAFAKELCTCFPTKKDRKVIELDEKEEVVELFMAFVARLGFINTFPEQDGYFSYHFIHLTIQEWFAADHLRRWHLGELSQAEPYHCEWQDEKYDQVEHLIKSFTQVDQSRFEVVLWFLSGSLRKNTSKFKAFFKALYQSSFSLGKVLVEQPELLFLLSRCLEESGAFLPKERIQYDDTALFSDADMKVYRDDIVIELEQLTRRLLFMKNREGYLKKYRKMYLSYMRLSPGLCHSDYLDLTNRLEALKKEPRVAEWVIVAQQHLISHDVITSLINLIHDQNQVMKVRIKAINILSSQTPPERKDDAMVCLIFYLSDEKLELRDLALVGLKKLGKVDDETVIQAHTFNLCNENELVKLLALKSLFSLALKSMNERKWHLLTSANVLIACIERNDNLSNKFLKILQDKAKILFCDTCLNLFNDVLQPGCVRCYAVLKIARLQIIPDDLATIAMEYILKNVDIMCQEDDIMDVLLEHYVLPLRSAFDSWAQQDLSNTELVKIRRIANHYPVIAPKNLPRERKVIPSGILYLAPIVSTVPHFSKSLGGFSFSRASEVVKYSTIPGFQTVRDPWQVPIYNHELPEMKEYEVRWKRQIMLETCEANITHKNLQVRKKASQLLYETSTLTWAAACSELLLHENELYRIFGSKELFRHIESLSHKDLLKLKACDEIYNFFSTIQHEVLSQAFFQCGMCREQERLQSLGSEWSCISEPSSNLLKIRHWLALGGTKAYFPKTLIKTLIQWLRHPDPDTSKQAYQILLQLDDFHDNSVIYGACRLLISDEFYLFEYAIKIFERISLTALSIDIRGDQLVSPAEAIVSSFKIVFQIKKNAKRKKILTRLMIKQPDLLYIMNSNAERLKPLKAFFQFDPLRLNHIIEILSNHSQEAARRPNNLFFLERRLINISNKPGKHINQSLLDVIFETNTDLANNVERICIDDDNIRQTFTIFKCFGNYKKKFVEQLVHCLDSDSIVLAHFVERALTLLGETISNNALLYTKYLAMLELKNLMIREYAIQTLNSLKCLPALSRENQALSLSILRNSKDNSVVKCIASQINMYAWISREAQEALAMYLNSEDGVLRKLIEDTLEKNQALIGIDTLKSYIKHLFKCNKNTFNRIIKKLALYGSKGLFLYWDEIRGFLKKLCFANVDEYESAEYIINLLSEKEEMDEVSIDILVNYSGSRVLNTKREAKVVLKKHGLFGLIKQIDILRDINLNQSYPGKLSHRIDKMIKEHGETFLFLRQFYHHSNDKLKMLAIRFFSQFSDVDSVDITVWIEALGDKSINLRKEAKHALQRHHQYQTPQTLKRYIELLNSQSYDIQRASQYYLCHYTTEQIEEFADTFALLKEYYHSKKVKIKAFAIKILSLTSLIDDNDITVWIEALGDESINVREEAKHALQRHHQYQTSQTLKRYIELLNSQCYGAQRASQYYLRHYTIGQIQESADTFSLLKEYYHSKKVKIKAFAITTLSLTSLVDDNDITFWTEALGDKSPSIRKVAHDALEHHAQLQSAQVLQKQIALLNKNNLKISEECIHHLSQCQKAVVSKHGILFLSLRQYYDNHNEGLKGLAIYQISQLTQINSKDIIAWIAALGDRSQKIRQAARDALQRHDQLFSQQGISKQIALLNEDNRKIQRESQHYFNQISAENVKKHSTTFLFLRKYYDSRNLRLKKFVIKIVCKFDLVDDIDIKAWISCLINTSKNLSKLIWDALSHYYEKYNLRIVCSLFMLFSKLSEEEKERSIAYLSDLKQWPEVESIIDDKLILKLTEYDVSDTLELFDLLFDQYKDSPFFWESIIESIDMNQHCYDLFAKLLRDSIDNLEKLPVFTQASQRILLCWLQKKEAVILQNTETLDQKIEQLFLLPRSQNEHLKKILVLEFLQRRPLTDASLKAAFCSELIEIVKKAFQEGDCFYLRPTIEALLCQYETESISIDYFKRLWSCFSELHQYANKNLSEELESTLDAFLALIIEQIKHYLPEFFQDAPQDTQLLFCTMLSFESKVVNKTLFNLFFIAQGEQFDSMFSAKLIEDAMRFVQENEKQSRGSKEYFLHVARFLLRRILKLTEDYQNKFNAATNEDESSASKCLVSMRNELAYLFDKVYLALEKNEFSKFKVIVACLKHIASSLDSYPPLLNQVIIKGNRVYFFEMMRWLGKLDLPIALFRNAWRDLQDRMAQKLFNQEHVELYFYPLSSIVQPLLGPEAFRVTHKQLICTLLRDAAIDIDKLLLNLSMKILKGFEQGKFTWPLLRAWGFLGYLMSHITLNESLIEYQIESMLKHCVFFILSQCPASSIEYFVNYLKSIELWDKAFVSNISIIREHNTDELGSEKFFKQQCMTILLREWQALVRQETIQVHELSQMLKQIQSLISHHQNWQLPSVTELDLCLIDNSPLTFLNRLVEKTSSSLGLEFPICELYIRPKPGTKKNDSLLEWFLQQEYIIVPHFYEKGVLKQASIAHNHDNFFWPQSQFAYHYHLQLFTLILNELFKQIGTYIGLIDLAPVTQHGPAHLAAATTAMPSWLASFALRQNTHFLPRTISLWHNNVVIQCQKLRSLLESMTCYHEAYRNNWRKALSYISAIHNALVLFNQYAVQADASSVCPASSRMLYRCSERFSEISRLFLNGNTVLADDTLTTFVSNLLYESIDGLVSFVETRFLMCLTTRDLTCLKDELTDPIKHYIKKLIENPSDEHDKKLILIRTGFYDLQMSLLPESLYQAIEGYLIDLTRRCLTRSLGVNLTTNNIKVLNQQTYNALSKCNLLTQTPNSLFNMLVYHNDLFAMEQFIYKGLFNHSETDDEYTHDLVTQYASPEMIELLLNMDHYHVKHLTNHQDNTTPHQKASLKSVNMNDEYKMCRQRKQKNNPSQKRYHQRLCRAIKQGKLNAVQQLVGLGVDVCSVDPVTGDTPLHIAARHPHFAKILLYLLKQRGSGRAQVNHKGETVESLFTKHTFFSKTKGHIKECTQKRHALDHLERQDARSEPMRFTHLQRSYQNSSFFGCKLHDQTLKKTKARSKNLANAACAMDL
jgi:S-adenosylhomocysteine hydrolase